MFFNAASFFAFIYSVQFFWGELIHQIFYVYDPDDNASSNNNVFEQKRDQVKVRFSYTDHLWNSQYFRPFLYLMNGCKKPHSAQVFT